MNMSAHPIAPEEVMAFVDGELSTARNDSVARHIAECDECRQAAAEFRGGSQGLQVWHVEAVPGRVEENVRAKLAQAQGEKSPRRFLPAWTKWVVGLGLTAAAMVMLGQRNGHKLMSPKPSAGTVAQSAARYVDSDGTLETYRQAQGMRKRAELSSSLEVSRDGQPITDQRSRVLSNQVTTLTSPGVAADSNGLFHGIGDHVQDTFSVTGAPMIARTVSLTLVVKDFAAARASLDTILARHHSYAAELTVNTAQGAPRTLNASLRVPAPELASALSELKSLGRVENESQTGEEVTQQHADLVARLKNSRETEQRLQAILQQRTGKISDVLQVEQEIARVRGEIEQMEAEQKALEHRVDFATINLNLADVYQAQLTMPSPSIATRLRNGFVDGFDSAVETLIGMVLFFAEYGPALLIWVIILVLPAVVLWRRYRRSLATL